MFLKKFINILNLNVFMENFIGREDELKFLQDKYSSNSSELILVYGRRRLGKTTLIKKSLSHTNGVYYLMTNDSPTKNLQSFKEILSETLEEPIINDIKVDSWDIFFRKIIQFIPEKYVIVFDEIPYIFSQQKSIISQFQKLYDEYFKPKKIKLVLCGSSISMMDEITSHSSPLYGRRTGKIHLQPFTIKETNKFLNLNNLEDTFKYHLLFSGVPYYLEQININNDFSQNIENLFFSRTTIFDDEVQFLLKEEFREIRNYISILKAIAKGKNTYSLISQSIDINSSSLSSYLISLENLQIISQKRSFFDKENSKKTRYELEDNFIYIWFRVFEKYKKQMLNSTIKNKIILEILPANLGFLFEKECRKILQVNYEKVGNFFNKEGIEIDIIALREDQIDIFECKFKENENEQKIIEKTKNKIQYLPKDIKISSIKLISINKGITLKNLLKF